MVTFENQKRSNFVLKDLSTIEGISTTSSLFGLDNKIFSSEYSGIVRVVDKFTNETIDTLITGGNSFSPGITYDDDYLYIGKVVETITDRKYRSYFVRKYNRSTLEFISESLALYTGDTATTVTNSTNIFGIVENGDYLYLACVEITLPTNNHKIRKIRKSDLTEVSFVEWRTPLSITKASSGLGFFVAGANTILTTGANYTKVDFIDWDLQVIKTLARSENNISLTRRVLEKDGKVFIVNDKGLIIKVDFLTNTLETEIQNSEQIITRSFKLVGDKILMMNASGKIYLYNTNLVLLYTWDFYPTGTGTTGDLENDLNNTVWINHEKTPNILYKKQFIDLTKGII